MWILQPLGRTRLLPLDGGRGFCGDVVDDAVDALDLLHDAGGRGAQHGVGQLHPIGGDGVVGVDGAQGDHVLIRSAARGVHARGEAVVDDGEVLPHLGAEPRLFDLFAEDGVRVTQDGELLAGDLAYASHAETGAGEGLTVDDEIGQTQLASDFAHFEFVKVADGLHQTLEADVLGQTAHVVVGLDQLVLAVGAALDDVGEDGALGEELHLAQLLRLFLEHADELFTDDLALSFGVGDALQLVKETIRGVDRHEVHAELILEDLLHLFELALAQQPVIDEDADEVAADRFVYERGAHRAVHAAGKPEQHLFVTDLCADGGNLLFDEILFHLSSCDEARDAPTPVCNLIQKDYTTNFFFAQAREGRAAKILRKKFNPPS